MSHVRIASPTQLIASIPAVLGFHPEESLVALWVDKIGELVFSIRFDLEMPEPMIARTLLDLIARQGAGKLLLVTYTSSSQPSANVTRLLDRLDQNQIPVADALLVAEVRWWSLLCEGPDCCPKEGTPILDVISDLELARITEGGGAVTSSRSELVDRYSLRPDERPTQAQLRHGAASTSGTLHSRAGLVMESLYRIASGSHGPSDCTAVMQLLQDVHVRDLTLGNIIANQSPEFLVGALGHVAVRTPEDLLPRVAGAAAAASAAMGTSSVRTWCLVDHAGDDSLAALVSTAMSRGVHPKDLQEVFTTAVRVLHDDETLYTATDS